AITSIDPACLDVCTGRIVNLTNWYQCRIHVYGFAYDSKAGHVWQCS
nr:hypothetical protein [Candidatus Cloacimonadota bacterium]